MPLVAREEPQVNREAEDPDDKEVERVQAHLALVLVREDYGFGVLRGCRDVDAEDQRRAGLREGDLRLRQGLFIGRRGWDTGCSEAPIGWIGRLCLLLRRERSERLFYEGSHRRELTLGVD